MLPPDELQQQIQQALEAVLSAPFQSAARARAMDRLLYYLPQHPGLKRVSHPDYSLALNQTWEWLSRHIDEFQPATGSIVDDLVRWMNGHLYWRIRDLYKFNPNEPLSLDNLVFEEGQSYLDMLSDDGFEIPSFSGLDRHIEELQRQERQDLAHQIENWIACDPDGLLQTCHPRGQPHCHCQLLADRLLLRDPPESLTDIADEMTVPYQTLVSHWKRKCLPLLQQQAQKFGYEP